jgi:polyhydroxyalkanoate synthesis repressor PhaR
MAILIKRYANRKLYNTDTSRYITLKGIATLLDLGDEVRVVDNETGEDITQVALSQILVDNKRAKEDPSDTLLTQILSRGGDALYGAIRKSVDDATEGIGDFQERFRQLVGQADPSERGGLGFAWDSSQSRSKPEAASSRHADSDAEPHARARAHADGLAPNELDQLVRDSVTDAIESLDLPRRRDIETLSRNFERVAKAIERLERAYLPKQQGSRQKSGKPETNASE